jgi:hypothetical protein
MSGERSQRVDEDAAHDVLAAEAFAVPAPDPELRQRQIRLPEDPSGIAEPHDILAAEEFAMPAARPAPVGSRASTRPSRGGAVAAALGGLILLLRLRRRR